MKKTNSTAVNIREDVIVFSGEINNEDIAKTVSFISNLEINIPLRIYFSTPGGHLQAGEIFIDYLNHLTSMGKQVCFVANWEVSSMGLIILLKLNCKIELLNTFSVLHVASRNIDYRQSLKTNGFESFHENRLERSNTKLVILLKELGIAQSDIDKIRKGNDVYLDTEKIRKLLEKKQKGK